MSSQNSKTILIEQGTCYLVDINPPHRSKPRKIRPVVVLQTSDTLKAGSPGVVIVPLTTQLKEENILRVRIHPSQELKLSKSSDALLDQVHTIDRSLFIQEVGVVPHPLFLKIQEGVRFLLGF